MSVAGQYDCVTKSPMGDQKSVLTVNVDGDSWTGSNAGQMGALEVETPEGIRFALGSGFSDAQRADPPPVGTWVTYRYNGLTDKGIPRFARFLRVREGWTPPE